MVGAKSAGETAWVVEDTLNRVISGAVPLTATVQKLLRQYLNVFNLNCILYSKRYRKLILILRPLVLIGQQLQQNQSS